MAGDQPPYASRVIKGPVEHEREGRDNGTASFEYDAGTNTITEQPDSSPATPMTRLGSPPGACQRAARLAGTVVIGGSSLYKIDLPHGLIGYLSPTTTGLYG